MASPKAIVAVLALATAVTHARLHRLQADGAAQADGGAAEEAAASILAAPPAKADQRLTICNAYPSPETMTVMQLHSTAPPAALTQAPLAYKRCQALNMPLSAGVELEFRLGSSPVGEFTASEVPEQAMSLLLVASRKRAGFKAIAFDSHAFADSDLAQVAVIDAYRGPDDQDLMKISRRATEAKDGLTLVQQGEGLQYGSIAFLNPGDFDVRLGDGSQSAKLAAEKGKNYVLLRVGMGQNGTAFPKELVLFTGAAASRALAGLALALLVQLLGHR